MTDQDMELIIYSALVVAFVVVISIATTIDTLSQRLKKIKEIGWPNIEERLQALERRPPVIERWSKHETYRNDIMYSAAQGFADFDLSPLFKVGWFCKCGTLHDHNETKCEACDDQAPR